MNVLAIGNSFSQDALRYLHDIARADGVKLETVNLYISGCSLERHYRNMLSGERAYGLQYDGHLTGFSVSMAEALLSRPWDVVTLQQVSGASFDIQSFTPYLEELADYVRSCQPKAKLLIHQTWAYEEGSEKLTQVAGFAEPEQMLSGIRDAYTQAAARIKADGIIPSGELFGKLLEKGIPKIHRDTYHATLGLGRCALGLLWYRMLTGNAVAGNCFRDLDEPVSEDAWELVKACVDSFAPLSL